MDRSGEGFQLPEQLAARHDLVPRRLWMRVVFLFGMSLPIIVALILIFVVLR